MTVFTPNLQTHWQALQPILTIRDEADYDRAIEQLDTLIDEVGTDENHPLYDLLDALGTIVHAYEEENEPMPTASGSEVLQFLME